MNDISKVLEEMRHETAVLTLIDGYRDIKMDESEIQNRIMEKFNLTKSEAQVYMNLAQEGQSVIVAKNEREVGRFIPKDDTVSYLTDSLTGILKGDYNLDEGKSKRLMKKYKATN